MRIVPNLHQGRRAFLRRAAACAAAAGLPGAAHSEGGAGRSFVPQGYRLSFGDDFDDTDVTRINETARGGRAGAPAWRSRYRHERHTVINGEKQVYVDVDYAGRGSAPGQPLRVQPFAIADGVLTITAERADERMASLFGGQRYVSGCITSELTHWQRYGYFEMCARLPAGRGFWPAFWLLPKSGTWPPEIDVFEGSGARPRGVHLGIIEKGRSKARPGKRQVDGFIDTTDGFHVYGAEWTADDVRFFIDGQLQFTSGPHQLHEPMYMLANLAVGSKDANWIPDPDGTTPWPGRFEIDHVRAYVHE